MTPPDAHGPPHGTTEESEGLGASVRLVVAAPPFDPETGLTAEEGDALNFSVRGLLEQQPLMSASTTFSRGQVIGVVTGLAIVATAAVLAPAATGVTLVAIAMVLYLSNLVDRVLLFSRGVGNSPEIHIAAAAARAISDEDLPVYTVFVPAFQEPEVVTRLIGSLGALDYPKDKLDIQLLLEADDTQTVQLAQEGLQDGLLQARIILVPPAEPRTKPKACNYGLQFARGELVTIYDAEDLPEPLQLRRAAAAFRQLPDSVACIQAKLGYHNDRQNLLTRWFTSEYDQWFGYSLPGLMMSKAPIPLGGTSNHMRCEVLKELGGWDPFNVTEDADLGIRLFRHGYRTAVLESRTLEEANSDPINWLRQRSRWYKGYLQTFLVHMRQPRRLWKELGTAGILRFASITAGTPIISVINTIFWGLALAWELGEPGFVRVLFPPFLFYPAIMSLVFGNSAMIYCGLVAARVDKNPRLLGACLLVPAYWVLMSVAAVKAFVQLVFQPSYWEKTVHGLDTPR
jgi:cellulose synthase/poly-beta-1,6-N-acetylglucosamine synthase-like glycosyltransferase